MAVVVLIFAAVAVGIDQIIKTLVINLLKPVGTIHVIPNFLDFVYVENRGAAFGILQNQTWLFVVLTAVVSAAIIIALFLYDKHSFCSYTACTLIVAGGIGNLIDRLYYHFVIDYFKVSFFPPVFNFADCCVTVGCVLLIIHILFLTDRNKKTSYSHHYYSAKR